MALLKVHVDTLSIPVETSWDNFLIYLGYNVLVFRTGGLPMTLESPLRFVLML